MMSDKKSGITVCVVLAVPQEAEECVDAFPAPGCHPTGILQQTQRLLNTRPHQGQAVELSCRLLLVHTVTGR